MFVKMTTAETTNTMLIHIERTATFPLACRTL